MSWYNLWIWGSRCRLLQVVAGVVLMDELFLPDTFDAQITLAESKNANFKESTKVVKKNESEGCSE